MLRVFSELLQLLVDNEMMPTQLSSSPVKPKTRTTSIQAADNELEKRLIIVYGVPQSTSVNKVEVAADGTRHDIESLEPYFRYVLAKDESIQLCKHSRVGTRDSNSTDRLRPVKIILVGGYIQNATECTMAAVPVS